MRRLDYYDTNSGSLLNTDLWFASISIIDGTVSQKYRLTSGNNYWEQAPAIACSGNNIYVIYYNYSTSSKNAYIDYIESSDGTSWSSPVHVSDNATANDTAPVADVFSDGNYDIYFDKVPEFNMYALIPLLITLPIVLRRKWRRANI